LDQTDTETWPFATGPNRSYQPKFISIPFWYAQQTPPEASGSGKVSNDLFMQMMAPFVEK